MIEAAYAVNEYWQQALESSSLNAGELYPGQFAPSIEDGSKFVTYIVIPNDTYDLAGLKEDYVTYRFYNPDFDELHKIIKVVRDTFNVYNIQNSQLAETGVDFKETFFRTVSTTEASFVEGIDYYVMVCELTMQYTEYEEEEEV